MWALIFFILEHVKDVKTNVELASTVEHALATIENPKISTSLHQTIVQVKQICNITINVHFQTYFYLLFECCRVWKDLYWSGL